MAACGSLQHVFENPLPGNQTLLDSRSPWPQIKPTLSNYLSLRFSAILLFKESYLLLSSSYPSSSSSSSEEENETKNQSKDLFSSSLKTDYSARHRKSDSFSSMNSESLQLCTEGLGFEGSDDVEDLKDEVLKDKKNQDDQKVSVVGKNLQSENYRSETIRRSKTCLGAFPPPISCIGKSGKPWVYFKSHRQDGRFVLKEIRDESHEFLHACRENGRLTLHFVQLCEEDDDEERHE